MNVLRSYLASQFKGTRAGNVMVALFNAAAVPSLSITRRVSGEIYRARVAGAYVFPQAVNAVKWLTTSSETSNFSYPITSRNMLHIAAAVSVVTGTTLDIAQNYIRELQEDAELARHLAANGEPGFYARRVGWYAVARIVKPRVVVETGVHAGVGAVVLCAALKSNAAEGRSGRYCGTDINPAAGRLLSGTYADHGRILYGDSLASLAKLSGPIDLFINDSDHSADYERHEYLAVKDKLAPNALILSDNAHETDELLSFSRLTGRRFLFVAEKPQDHFYPGAGIGFSFI